MQNQPLEEQNPKQSEKHIQKNKKQASQKATTEIEGNSNGVNLSKDKEDSVFQRIMKQFETSVSQELARKFAGFLMDQMLPLDEQRRKNDGDKPESQAPAIKENNIETAAVSESEERKKESTPKAEKKEDTPS